MIGDGNNSTCRNHVGLTQIIKCVCVCVDMCVCGVCVCVCDKPCSVLNGANKDAKFLHAKHLQNSIRSVEEDL